MKRPITMALSLGLGLVLILLPRSAGAAQAATPPERINFQGVLRDASGAPVLDGTYEMLFRFFGNGAGACDCGGPNFSAGCSDPVCQNEVCGVDDFCCSTDWDTACGALAEQFTSCQVCIADEEVLIDDHTTALFPVPPVPVTDGLFNVALGTGAPIDGSGSGTYASLGELFRDFDVVYVEIEIGGEVLSPRIRVESSAFTQNALRLEGKRATEFVDTSSTPQEKTGGLTVNDLTVTGTLAGDLDVSGMVTVGSGGIEFSDGSIQSTALPADPPCYDEMNRFVDCANGTVTDTVTGLIWLRNSGCLGSDFLTAIEAAENLKDGDCGLTDNSSPGDWRLPTKEEWETMFAQAVTNGCSLPAFPDKEGTGCCATSVCAFPSVQPTWTSTTDAASPGNAWVSNDTNGAFFSVTKTGFRNSWPVRSAR